MAPLSLIGKRSLKSLAAACGGGWLLSHQKKRINRVLILAFHRVVADILASEKIAHHGLVVSAETFEQQLRILQRNYEVITLDDAAALIRGEKSSPRPTAVITFDDGYVDNYEIAWPILKRLGIPAIIYLPTSMIGQSVPLDHDRLHWLLLHAHEQHLDLIDVLQAAGLSSKQSIEIAQLPDLAHIIETLVYLPMKSRTAIIEVLENILGEINYPDGFRLMNWEMAKQMSTSGIAFGSHSKHHPILSFEDADTVTEEVRQSKLELESKLGFPVRHFAYPNGHFNFAVRNAVAAAGYKTAVTTQRNTVCTGDDLLTCGRISLCEESTRGISGKYTDSIARMRLRV